jgi:hypothetical protein
MDEALITEWYTGRDAQGEESARLGHRWSTGTVGLLRDQRIYRPHVGDLGAWLKRPDVHTRVRIAIGVDGQDDIRIEQQVAPPAAKLYLAQAHPDFPKLTLTSDPRTITPDQLGAITVERWRPVAGLDHVTEHHGAQRRSANVLRPDVAAQIVDRISDLVEGADDRDLEQRHTALRAARACLVEHRLAIAEAKGDATAVDAKLVEVATKILPIEAERTARKAIVRAQRIAFAQQRAAIYDADPDAKVVEVDGQAVKLEATEEVASVG